MRKAVLYRDFSPEFDNMLIEGEVTMKRFEERHNFLMSQLKQLNAEIGAHKDSNEAKLKALLYTAEFEAKYPKDKFHIHIENEEVVYVCDDSHGNPLKDLLGVS